MAQPNTASEVTERLGIQPHGMRKLANRYLMGSAGLTLLCIVGAANSMWFVPLGFGGVAVWIGYVGLRVRRVGAAVQHINRAFHAVVTGELEDARLLHEAAEQLAMDSSARRAITLQRAIIALRDGNLSAARARCDEALALPSFWLTRSAEEQQLIQTRGLRALVLAAQGVPDAAMRDVEAVRAHPAPSPDALARAELGVALDHQRAGRRDALRGHLTKHRHLLQNYTAPRERAIYRGLERLLQVETQSIYRTLANEVEAPAPDDWIAKVVPEIADYVRRRDEGEPIPDGPAEVSVDGLTDEQRRREGTRLEASEPKRELLRAAVAKRVLVVWVAILILGGLVFAVLPDGGPGAEPEGWLLRLSMTGAMVFPLVFAGIIAFNLRRQAVDGRRVAAAVARWARGDLDGGIADLQAATEVKTPLAAASAHKALADLALRDADLSGALNQVDLALGKLSAQQRAIGSDILVPSLVGHRAAVLAAQGRIEEARATLAVLFERHPSFPYVDAAKRGVALYDAAHRGDVETLARLAVRSTEAAVSEREELLLDLGRATLQPGALRLGERERLVDAVIDPGRDRAWVERIAPRVLKAFERATPSSA